MATFGRYANIADEMALLRRLPLPGKTSTHIDMALDSACCLYDHASSQVARTRNEWVKSREQRNIQLAKEIIWALGETLREIEAAIKNTIKAPSVDPFEPYTLSRWRAELRQEQRDAEAQPLSVYLQRLLTNKENNS